MGLRIRPLWDPTGTVSVELDEDRRELSVAAGGERLEFGLRDDRPDLLGWVERRLADGDATGRRVSVGEVVGHCLRELEAEQRVLGLSRTAARRAVRRGGPWAGPGRRLADQVTAAPRRQRVSTLPFRVLFEHRSGDPGEGALEAVVAAERIGYRIAEGGGDAHRLRRRLGLACHRDGRGGGGRRQRFVRYETGVALCRAVDVDPVELGL